MRVISKMAGGWWVVAVMLLALPVWCGAAESGGAETVAAAAVAGWPWWIWLILLFVFCFGLGIVAALGGVGGGVLFVPIVSGFFPFHLDYVRGAGLMVALAGSLAASPGLLRGGMVNLRLAAPFALAASCSAIVGSLLGLALPARVVQTALGLTILGIVALMARARNSAYPEVKESDPLARRLEMCGVYHEPGAGRDVHWRIHRTPVGILLFFIIGLMAGMFGLGAGWANVPVLNLVLGAPLKVAVATSLFILSVVDTAAAWVYLHNGAVLPLIAVPSMFGMMLGARIGARLLKKAHPAAVRRIVLVVLLLAGARALLRGLGI